MRRGLTRVGAIELTLVGASRLALSVRPWRLVGAIASIIAGAELEIIEDDERVAAEFRVAPLEASRLLEEDDLYLPPAERLPMPQTSSRDAIGGRPGVYDAHIAEIARAAGAAVVVTDNRRHFLSALRYDMRVETPAEFLAALKTRR